MPRSTLAGRAARLDRAAAGQRVGLPLLSVSHSTERHQRLSADPLIHVHPEIPRVAGVARGLKACPKRAVREAVAQIQ